jgi:hypothetical protein
MFLDAVDLPDDHEMRAEHMRSDCTAATLVHRVTSYSLDFHAEQYPNAASRVLLDGTVDPLGVPRIKVDDKSRRDSQRQLMGRAFLAAE